MNDLLDIINITIPFSAFIFFIILNIILFRLHYTFIKCYIISFLFGEFVLILLYFSFISLNLFFIETIFNSIFYFALTFFYFTVIGIALSSLRVKILNEIYFNNGTLTKQSILKNYNADIIIESRINRLEKSGDIYYKDEKYFLNRNDLLKLVKIINLFRKIFFGKF